MSLPWKTILTNVPWSEVIGSAPKIADGAKKLWQTVGRKSGEPPSNDPTLADNPSDPTRRLSALEAAQRDLLAQLQASGELLQALSEQNARLVAEIESHRRRARLQAWAIAATALLASLALAPHLLEFFA